MQRRKKHQRQRCRGNFLNMMCGTALSAKSKSRSRPSAESSPAAEDISSIEDQLDPEQRAGNDSDGEQDQRHLVNEALIVK